MPYRSTVDNVCHACGHDVHTTVLLGTGLALAQLDARGELPGRVRLIFQPSEEQFPSGAPEVISEGGLKDVDAIFAMHCFPQLPVGLVARPLRPADRRHRHGRDQAHRARRAHGPAAPDRRPGARPRTRRRRRADPAQPADGPARRGEHGLRRGPRRRGREHDPDRGSRARHRARAQSRRLAGAARAGAPARPRRRRRHRRTGPGRLRARRAAGHQRPDRHRHRRRRRGGRARARTGSSRRRSAWAARTSRSMWTRCRGR